MDKRQIDKFKDAARELEANDDPAEFDRKMRMAKLKTPPKDKEKKEKPGK